MLDGIAQKLLIMKKLTLLLAFLFIGTMLTAQNDQDSGSVIQNLTPSKLIKKGQVDIKWFNNLFTQTRGADSNGDVITVERGNFFTSTLDFFYGVSENRRLNIGLILEFRSNTIGGRGAFDVFSFDGERGTARSGLTNVAPSVKFVPFKKISNFSIQSSLFLSTINSEQEDGFIRPLLDENNQQVFDENGQALTETVFNSVFLDQDGTTWQNRFFYDLPLGTEKEWQLFFDLNTELNFGDDPVRDDNGNTIEGSFANDSLRLIPGVFLSYFPSSKFTVQGFVQHFQLIDLGNDFEQDLTSVGGGAKFQLTKSLNIEALFSYFVRGNDTGLGESYNIGLRYVL